MGISDQAREPRSSRQSPRRRKQQHGNRGPTGRRKIARRFAPGAGAATDGLAVVAGAGPCRRSWAILRAVHRRLRVSGLWLALTAQLSCSQPEGDPLDPAAVEEVAKGQGDATGAARSGAYRLRLVGAPSCDCPMTSEIALCSVDLSTLTVEGVAVTITQSDGFLQLSGVSSAGQVELSGAIEGSGDFDLGGIYDLGNVLGEGSLYIRLTGRFTGPDEFSATLLDRARGSYGDQSIDCRTEGEVVGERLMPEPR